VPVPPAHEPLLRSRQRECGVDMDCIDRGADCHKELLDLVGVALATLHT
jgi:hypothetical protein